MGSRRTDQDDDADGGQMSTTWKKRRTNTRFGEAGLAILLLASALLLLRRSLHGPGEATKGRSDMAAATVARTAGKVVRGTHVSEGAGVRVCRTLGTPALRNLDPFLMLDELRLPSKDAKAGFPWHPHRGQETVTIVLDGRVRHEDSLGNKGVIGPGGVQWMTAGRGIVHSEMPESSGDAPLWGFQLWVNLPKKEKMCKPRYQDVQQEGVPVIQQAGNQVRVLAGQVDGQQGAVKTKHPILALDVKMDPGSTFVQPIPRGWNAFVYVCQGKGVVGGSRVSNECAVVLEDGDQLETSTEEGMRFLLFGGLPIGEPIVQHGPFVMNTQEEIYQAFADYQSNRLQDPNDDVWTDTE